MSNRHYQHRKCSFNLPNLTGYAVPRGAVTNIGTSDNGALPDIQGQINSSRVGYWDDATHTGGFADSYKRTSGSAAGYDTSHKGLVVVFKASSYNSIYGTSTIVRPKGVNMMYAIKF